jgi:carbonic anhydrase
VSTTDELLAANAAYAATFAHGDLPKGVSRKVAVVACMDARLDPLSMMGLGVGEAHVIRNAGGIVTDEEIRSLVISQVALGTEEIVIIHHTDCGMSMVGDDEFRGWVEAATGTSPPWSFGCFDDLDESVRDSIARLRESPYLPHKGSIRGFVYDVRTGRLREVS